MIDWFGPIFAVKGQIIVVAISLAALALLIARFNSTAAIDAATLRGGEARSWDALSPAQWPGDPTAKQTGDEDAKEGVLNVLLVGDIALGEHEFTGAEKNPLAEKGYEHPFANVAPLLESADEVVGVLSAPLIDPANKSQGVGGKHWSDAAKVGGLLKKLGFTAVSVANLHMMDMAQAGLESTIKTLDDTGVAWFGAGRTEDKINAPHIIEKQVGRSKVKIAIFGATQRVLAEQIELPPNPGEENKTHKRADDKAQSDSTGDVAEAEDAEAVSEAPAEPWDLARFKLDKLTAAIQQLREAELGTIIVVYPSWGSPYRWIERHQQVASRKIMEAGADLLVGHGARMAQQINHHKGGYVFHNIGDFVYNGRKDFEQRKQSQPYGLAVKLTFIPEGETVKRKMKVYPVHVDNKTIGYQPRFLTAREYGKLYWNTIIRSWQEDDRWLKRHLGLGNDQFGRYFRVGKYRDSYDRKEALGKFIIEDSEIAGGEG